MFRQKEYIPIGPKPDPIDNDKRFISKDFDKVYQTISDFQTLKNELWSGINAGRYLIRYSGRFLESALQV